MVEMMRQGKIQGSGPKREPARGGAVAARTIRNAEEAGSRRLKLDSTSSPPTATRRRQPGAMAFLDHSSSAGSCYNFSSPRAGSARSSG